MMHRTEILMRTDHPDFIQCAFDAYEQGLTFDAIEEECTCRLSHYEIGYTSIAIYPTALAHPPQATGH